MSRECDHGDLRTSYLWRVDMSGRIAGGLGAAYVGVVVLEGLCALVCVRLLYCEVRISLGVADWMAALFMVMPVATATCTALFARSRGHALAIVGTAAACEGLSWVLYYAYVARFSADAEVVAEVLRRAGLAMFVHWVLTLGATVILFRQLDGAGQPQTSARSADEGKSGTRNGPISSGLSERM